MKLMRWMMDDGWMMLLLMDKWVKEEDKGSLVGGLPVTCMHIRAACSALFEQTIGCIFLRF